MLVEMARGRPSRKQMFERLDQSVEELSRVGGLPLPEESRDIWEGIWYEETHNSTAIEGNTLILKEVKALLEQGKAVGDKELKEYLEVQGYAEAAEWVYEQAVKGPTPEHRDYLSLSELREIHKRSVQPVWLHFPPDHLDPQEGPGSFRRHDIAPFSGGMKPPPWTDIDPQIRDWVDSVNHVDQWHGASHTAEIVAGLHAEFERIHPFRDGNGRVGRLAMNLILVRQGYPPAIIYKKDRVRYLDALSKADLDDLGPLAELVARAVTYSVERFLIPALAGPHRYVPLSALVDRDLTHNALLLAAQRGRLKAIQQDNGIWYSSPTNVVDYKKSRYKRS